MLDSTTRSAQKRAIWVGQMVLDTGVQNNHFTHSAYGCLSLRDKSNGYPFLNVNFTLPSARAEFFFQSIANHTRRLHRLCRYQLTSSEPRKGMDPGKAVVVKGKSYYIGYASPLGREWNEAIAVVIAMHMHEVSPEAILDEGFCLKDKPYIQQLLEATQWKQQTSQPA